MTSHPWDLSDRLIAALAECPSVCEHLHLPVQSGDDQVLRRMGRQYTIEHYRERLARIREAVPGSRSRPTSSSGSVARPRSSSGARSSCSRRSATTRSSPRPTRRDPGTPATRLADDVPPEVKRRRLNELLAVQESIGLERNEAWLGRDGRGPRRTRSTPAALTPRARDDDAARDATDEATRLSGRTPRQQARAPAGGADLVGREVTRPHRARRAVRPAWQRVARDLARARCVDSRKRRASTVATSGAT